jgi:hypothetical protein
MSQDDQRAKQLDEAERNTHDMRLQAALFLLIQHLRSLPSEPKGETSAAVPAGPDFTRYGPGVPAKVETGARNVTAVHAWDTIATDDTAYCYRCGIAWESDDEPDGPCEYVPGEYRRVTGDACPGEPEPKVETGEGAQLRVTPCPECGRVGYVGTEVVTCRTCNGLPQKAHPPGALELTDEEWEALERAVNETRPANSHLSREAFRKLNARAGSEGLGPNDPGTHVTLEVADYALLHADAMTERARQKARAMVTPPAASEAEKCMCFDRTGRPFHFPNCAIHGTAARPSPEAVEADAGGDEDEGGAHAMFKIAMRTAPDLWDDHGPEERADWIAAYRFVRAESDGRVRELTEQSESWRRAELAWQKWAGAIVEQPEGGLLGDGPAREWISERLATLKAEKESAERSRDEFRDSADGEHALNEQLIRENQRLKDAKEAAEARVRAWRPVVEVIATASSRSDGDTVTSAIQRLKAIPEDLRPQPPAPGTEGREG